MSGTAELTELVNSDHQLARRVDVINLGTVSEVTDLEKIRHILKRYCAEAQIDIQSDLLADGFLKRLIHAGGNEFGLIIQTVIAGIEQAAANGKPNIEPVHFAAAFHQKSGCIPAFNPFVAEDYLAIDPRMVLAHTQRPETRVLR